MVRESVLPSPSIYDQINKVKFRKSRVEYCIPWLQEKGLVMYRDTFRVDPRTKYPGQEIQPGVVSRRVQASTKKELDALKAENQKLIFQLGNLEKIWHEIQDLDRIILSLDVDRMPRTSMGFYWPFHLSPYYSSYPNGL